MIGKELAQDSLRGNKPTADLFSVSVNKYKMKNWKLTWEALLGFGGENSLEMLE